MDGKIDSAIHLRIDIDQPLADGCGGRSESLDEGFNHPSLVASVVIDGGVGIFANLLHELLPDGLLIRGYVSPEGMLSSGAVIAYEKTDEIRQLPIWKPLNVQKEGNITFLDLRWCLDVNLAASNGERLYFEVEVVRSLPIASPPSSRLEQIGKLGNRENSPTVVSLHRF